MKITTETIQISDLVQSGFQTRVHAFEDISLLKALADSIATKGLLELPKVRRQKDGVHYEVLTGHRRIEAVSRFLHSKEIMCDVYHDLDDKTAFGILLTDNIQRQNLEPYEEGMAYLLFKKKFNLDADYMASFFNISPQTVRNRISLTTQMDNLSNLLHAKEDKENFLRHFSQAYTKFLSKLEDDNLKQALKMIADGKNMSDILEFVNLCEVSFSRQDSSEGRDDDDNAIMFSQPKKAETVPSFACVRCGEKYHLRAESAADPNMENESETRSYQRFTIVPSSEELKSKEISIEL